MSYEDEEDELEDYEDELEDDGEELAENESDKGGAKAAQQAKQKLKQKAKQEIKKKAVKEVGKKVATKVVAKYLLIGLAIIVLTIIFFALITMFFHVGEAQAYVSVTGLPPNITEEQREDYRERFEKKSFTPMSETDNSYIDEVELRLPWAVIAEVNSWIYNGEATEAELQQIFDELKPVYTTAYDDVDTYTTEECHKIYYMDGEEEKWYWSDPVVTLVRTPTRNIITKAETWEGTVTRQYTQKTYVNVDIQGDTKIIQTDVIWEFTQTIDKNYIRFKEFCLERCAERGVTVLDSEISLMVEQIYLMLEKDDWSAESNTNGGPSGGGGPFTPGVLLWPSNIDGVSCHYGNRHRCWPGGSYETRIHYGVDVKCPGGSPIYAMKDGTVVEAKFGTGEGYEIIIDHGNDAEGINVRTRYIHLQAGSFKVTQGQVVSQGDIIALSGNTGTSAGGQYHLHFEVMHNRVCIDPLQYFNITIEGNACVERGHTTDPKTVPGNNYGTYIPMPAAVVKGSAEIEAYIQSVLNNPTEMDYLTRVAIGEEGSNKSGRMAVVEVVLRRIRIGGGTVTSHMNHNEFECVTNGSPPTFTVGKSDPRYSEAKGDVERVIKENTTYSYGARCFHGKSMTDAQFQQGFPNATLVFVVEYGNRFFTYADR